MPIPVRPVKGLQDIRSHSGRPQEAILPYKAFMRLCSLEMEKFRRTKERESAMSRVKNIDARLLDIEIEMAAILEVVREDRSVNPFVPQAGESGTRPAQNETAGFRLKY
jgi:hypothetical protein